MEGRTKQKSLVKELDNYSLNDLEIEKELKEAKRQLILKKKEKQRKQLETLKLI